jgi:hypothetical protein
MTTFLTPAQVAASYPRLSVSHLANLRWERRGPKFIRTPGNRILYLPAEIEAYLTGTDDEDAAE